jgi:hypothetical protein
LRFWVNVLVISLLIVCIVFFVHTAFAVTYQEAADQVAEADQTLRNAFNGVLDAEKNGANVSALLPRLTEAGSALTRAEEALRIGNYSDAVNRASTCKSLVSSVAGDAVALKIDAVAASGNWWIMVLFSVAASVVFGVVLLFVWRWFRRGYLKRMLGSRPEVTG